MDTIQLSAEFTNYKLDIKRLGESTDKTFTINSLKTILQNYAKFYEITPLEKKK